MAKHFDIIVVGCGPTGAIASLLLAQKGLQVAIVEQHQNVYPHPRAIALNGFSMGLIKELLQVMKGIVSLIISYRYFSKKIHHKN